MGILHFRLQNITIRRLRISLLILNAISCGACYSLSVRGFRCHFIQLAILIRGRNLLDSNAVLVGICHILHKDRIHGAIINEVLYLFDGSI